MKILERQLQEYPGFGRFLAYLNSSSLLQGAVANIDLLYAKYGKAYLGFAEELLGAMTSIEIDPAPVFEAYIYEYLRDLARFEKTGAYSNGSFDEIRAKVYDNGTLMSETYLPGLFVAYGFSSLLYEKYKFFERAFVPWLAEAANGVEIGFGDGFYLWTILKRVSEIRVTGLDISQHALDFTTKLLAASGIAPARYELRLGNLCEPLDLDDRSQDWCVLTEVIEHVADPAFSLGEISRIMKAGGVFFMSTVIDSNHMDHITNFDSPQVMIDLLRSVGFAIEDSLEYVVSREMKEIRDRAVGLAFVCRKSDLRH
jgi:ubiquinone/menaquinone biosynthesis C-methylase UbiE